MKKQLLFLFLMVSSLGFSQGVVTGKILAGESNQPLAGASVIEAGTSNGTITDFDGNFTLNVSSNSGALEISYLGFNSSRKQFSLSNGTADLGSFSLQEDADALNEVVIIGKGIIDLAADRKTPVAVSTITSAQIQAKATGNVEFGEAMKNTPSVYVSNQAGGFGDSQIFLRGFDQTNTAYLLNGQPINGMEDGRMYWSNWSGMSDVASAIQIQRGLGSSKLAISSVGGTVNIVSKTTDSRQGGFVRFLAGNDSYFKGTASYNTGLNDNGWAFSFLMDHWQGHRKYAEGTAGQGQNYMFSVGYKPNDKHAFNFLVTGAPQWHDQNFSNSLETYEERGEKYNGNSGFLNGERKSERRNYYHKPVANLNWDFDINENLDLSTVLYASWGRGGGTGPFGRGSRVRDDNGRIDWAQIIANNVESAENGIGNNDDSRILRASVNNHNWYGALSNLGYTSDNWSFNVGVDGRTYTGFHFRQIVDYLGLDGFEANNRVLTEAFEPNPWQSLFNFADESDRIDYDYSETINYVGGFGQIEYATDSFSAFVQGAVSTQSFQRDGRFPSDTDGLGKSEKVTNGGYNVKGGMSYSFDDNHSIFANAGFYSRQPYLDNIFVDVRRSNELVSPEIDNEEVTGIEGGYRFKNNNLRINIDVYWTEWGNRFLEREFEDNTDPDNPIPFTDRLTGITQVHKGFEYEVEYRPDYGNWRFRSYGSIGNWKYDGSSPFTRQNDDTGVFVITDGNTDLTGAKIGNAPQTSFGFGGSVDIIENVLIFDADYNIYTDLYRAVDPLAASTGKKLSPYTLADAGLTYRFNFGEQRLVFRANVYNVFNEAYVGQADRFGVYLGVGRTYNASLRYNF
ncbi:MAG: TonB-dependent receptor [Flavobacteriaceae bacterium]